MNKTLLIGLAAFGGLVLITTFTNNEPEADYAAEAPASVTIPAEFASQFPIYPGATVVVVNESEGESSRDVSASLNTTASREEIFDWYSAALSDGGWNIKSDRNVAGYRIMQSENDNLFTSLQVAGTEEAGVQRISQQFKVRK